MLRPLQADAQDIAECRELLAGGSKTFYAASFLLPRRVRDPATALYAFCRLADDAIDLGEASSSTIDALMSRLSRAYAGTPDDHPADRAFSATVLHYMIPRTLPEALIEGFAWDRDARQYETIHDLKAYGARVAGTVGAMMAVLMGATDTQRIARACDLGIAMQLTNIARDIGDDARAGRLYLPRSWMRYEGIDPDQFLARPAHSDALARVVARLLAVADDLYRSSEPGIAALPSDCRLGILAARHLYAGIGTAVARNAYDSVAQRAYLSTSRKAAVLSRVALQNAQWSWSTPTLASDVTEEARFLVEAATIHSVPSIAATSLRWWNVYGGIVRAIEIFESLERRDRALPHNSTIDLNAEGLSGA